MNKLNYLFRGSGAGDYVTSEKLNEEMRQFYMKKPFHIFWKWVTKERNSPGWGAVNIINYPIGKIITADDAQISDQQCGPGLHVFRPGLRPEWFGLENNNLICIEVKVMSEDICFAGLPTMDAKIRVKKLEVLT